MRFVIAVSMLLVSANGFAQQEDRPAAPIVFFDIAGQDSAELQSFYRDLFGWDSSAGGELTIPVVSPLPGLIRQDPTETRIYIGVEDIAATLEEITERGGTVDAPRFEVSGVVVLGLWTDPAGNPMALVEMEDGAPKVP